MNPKSVLYVEDESDIRQIVKRILSKNGIEVHDFSTGEAAVENAPGIVVDLILMDVMLKEMDGPSALNQLRKIDGFEDVPCVFLTAKVDLATLGELERLENAAIIFKPFDLDRLLSDLTIHYQRLRQGE